MKEGQRIQAFKASLKRLSQNSKYRFFYLVLLAVLVAVIGFVTAFFELPFGPILFGTLVFVVIRVSQEMKNIVIQEIDV
jgi:fatty acid desaturase